MVSLPKAVPTRFNREAHASRSSPLVVHDITYVHLSPVLGMYICMRMYVMCVIGLSVAELRLIVVSVVNNILM